MPKIFISYSRKNIDIARYIAAELHNRGADVFIDYQSIQAGQNFPRRIADEIDTSNSFIFLLSKHSAISQWVIREIEYADQQKKLIIPVALDSTGLPPELFFLNRIDRVDLTGWTQDRSIEDGLRKLFRALSLPEVVITPPAVPAAPPAAAIPLVVGGMRLSRLLILIVVALFIVGILALISALQNPPITSTTPTTQAAINPTDSAETVAPTNTLSATEIELTVQSEMFGIQTEAAQTIVAQATATYAMQTAFAQQTVYAVGTADTNATATATLWTLTPTPDARQTAEFRLSETRVAEIDQATATAARATQSALDQTATATLWTATPTLTPLQLAEKGVQSNADWQLYSQTFNGIEMMLVPAGCFDMGSEDGDSDEHPVTQSCIEQPFWLDRTEVIQADFARLNGVKANPNTFSGDNRPVENITWGEARDFCALRDARLPTEAEWEYAARGPDNLIYPWGNDFVADNVVYRENSNNQTANVGSHTAGASWVGALDMSGSVWEWVSSAYLPYPYVLNDGREDLIRTDAPRGVRGGSFNVSTINLRAADRYWYFPTNQYYVVGFRCAKDY